MREKLENILFSQLKISLPAEFKAMLVRGHSTNDRHIPYISLDVGELRPFGDLQSSDGMFEADVSVAIADSAHGIEYPELFKRIRAVMSAFENFSYAEENILINAIYYENETDARDDNNLGAVLTYKLVFQILRNRFVVDF